MNARLALAAIVLGSLAVATSVQADDTPRQLRTCMFMRDKMGPKLDELEKAVASSSAKRSDIYGVRASLRGFFQDMVRGGYPNCETCKNHAEWKKMRGEYEGFERRMAAIEKSQAKCTFGYPMPDGKIVPLSLAWSVDDWEATKTKANGTAMQKDHCWLDANPSEWYRHN